MTHRHRSATKLTKLNEAATTDEVCLDFDSNDDYHHSSPDYQHLHHHLFVVVGKMAAISCEQQKFLEELDILKKKAKCLQQEVECLELERKNCATDEERLQNQKRLECYEQRMRELERCLVEKTRQVEEAKECYRSLRQELHQFNIRLECTRKRRRGKDNCATNDVDDDHDNKDNKNCTATKATVAASSAVNAPASAAASKTTTSDQHQSSLPPSQQQSKQQQQQQTDANDKASSSAIPSEIHDPSETSPDCIDAPPGINQEPYDSSTPVRICEVSLKGKYIRLVNASSEEKDVGGHFIVQRKQDGPTTVFQFPESVPLPGKATVTVWSAASGSNRNSPPTDFVFSAQQEWLTGTDCTTVLCRPNQQAASWLTSESSSTVGPVCAGIRPTDVKQDSKVTGEEKKEDKKNGNEGEEKEEEKEKRKKSKDEEKEEEKEKERKKKGKDEADEDKKRTKGTDDGRAGGTGGKGKKKRSTSRSRSRSRKNKNKNTRKKSAKSSQRSEACEEEEEIDVCCGQREMDSSSDDCKGGGRMCEEEEECVEEEEEDCWWGQKRCSLDKTIPCASVHLGDDAAVRTKGQRSKVNGCSSNGVHECASSVSSDCQETVQQKETKQTDDCERFLSPSRKAKGDKATVDRVCPPAAHSAPKKKTKEKRDDCRSRGRGGGGGGGVRSDKTKFNAACNGDQRKRVKPEFGCCSNSSQELRAKNKNRSCNDDNDEFFVCPCDLDECKGQGAGQGWFGSWSSWFSRRCSEEKKVQEGADPCDSEDRKRTRRKEGCCEEKKVNRGGCCEEKKVNRGGCCEEKKVNRGRCFEEKKVNRGGCCEEKKATCEDKEDKCVDPCQQILRRIESDCGLLSSRSNPQLASGGRRAGGGARGFSLGGGGGAATDEYGCPCACRQSDSFSVSSASLMAAGLTVAAMYCA